MAFTDRLRQQHDAATILTRRLRNLVLLHRPGDDAVLIATELARLLSVLRIHLAEEDEHLYPALVATQESKAAALAERYRAEMGSLAWDVEDFMRHWSSSAVIALDFEAFQSDLDQLLGALVARIECENLTLYPVADALIPDWRGKAA